METHYVLNRSEYIYFLHETRNFLAVLSFDNFTGDLSMLLVVHSQMDGRKAPTSKTV